MPGIDDVDRRYGAKREACDPVAEMMAEIAKQDRQREAKEAQRVVREDWLDRAVEAHYGPAAADDDALDEALEQAPLEWHPAPLSAADRRDARLSALTLAAHVLPETPAAALADDMPIEAVTLRIARAFERYLLGDDPPKPPAKME